MKEAVTDEDECFDQNKTKIRNVTLPEIPKKPENNKRSFLNNMKRQRDFRYNTQGWNQASYELPQGLYIWSGGYGGSFCVAKFVNCEVCIKTVRTAYAFKLEWMKFSSATHKSN